MMRTTRGTLLLATLAVWALGATAQTPTLEELRALVADHQYPDALKQIAATLQLKGPAAQNVDRHQLYMLKAECHLQTKAGALALESYAAAAREAADPAARSFALAHEKLVKQSKGFAYSPKPTVGQGAPRPAP